MKTKITLFLFFGGGLYLLASLIWLVFQYDLYVHKIITRIDPNCYINIIISSISIIVSIFLLKDIARYKQTEVLQKHNKHVPKRKSAFEERLKRMQTEREKHKLD